MIEITLPIISLFILIGIICNIIDYKRYEKSTYKAETKRNYFLVKWDKGLRGEYVTSNFLNQTSGYKKLIFNAYIPKKEPSETSEIDIIMINEKGVFVIENKNYSGWIFGKEKDSKWCQSLNKSTKNFFYNPIKQNNTHIKYLMQFLKSEKEIPFASVIAFNNQATLKKITFDSDKIIVCNSTELKDKINSKMSKMNNILNVEDVENIYNVLKEKTKVSQEIKEQHINSIKEKYK